MSPSTTAAEAVTQQSWSKILRTAEASAGSPATPQSRPGLLTRSKLRSGVVSLQAAWLWVERKRSQQIASKRLRVAETISLGEKRTLSIVTVDDAQYLIGSSSSGVQLLTRLDSNCRNEVSS